MIARLAAPALAFALFAIPTCGLYVWTEGRASPPVTPPELRDVQVRLHPWDVKAGLGSIIVLGVGLLASAGAFVWLLTRALSLAWVSRTRRKGA